LNTNFQCLLIAAASLLLAGCGTVHFDAPPGQRVRLLTRDDPTEVRWSTNLVCVVGRQSVERKPHRAVHATNQLVEVKMFTELSVGDNLINPITSISRSAAARW